MAETFEAAVNAWVRKSESRLLRVFQQSAQDLFEIAQTSREKGGRMPVDTGTLRNSFMAGLNSTSSLTPAADAYTAIIAGARIGDRIVAGWGGAAEAYAYVQEIKNGFARGAAAQWQAIVARNAREAQRRAG